MLPLDDQVDGQSAVARKERAMPGIVVGIDGSANARSALAWAVSEAAARRAPLTVLTVHELSHSFWSGRPVVLSADEDQLAAAKAAADELTDKAVSELGDSKPAAVTVRAVNGYAADELLAVAKGADMLVLGARGGAQATGLAAHSPIGSVSNKVLHRARCPVVVIPASD
jgi:nucleotide-binding universal stress UspA family protein